MSNRTLFHCACGAAACLPIVYLATVESQAGPERLTVRGIVIVDQDGVERIRLDGGDAAAPPRIVLMDSKKKARYVLDLDPDGSPSLRMFGGSDKPYINLSIPFGSEPGVTIGTNDNAAFVGMRIARTSAGKPVGQVWVTTENGQNVALGEK